MALRTKLILILATFLMLATAVGCGPSREATQVDDKELLGGGQQGDFDLKIQEAEAAWANRGDKAELEKAIALWEEALTLDATGGDEAARRQAVFEVYAQLSRAYYLLADGHIRFEADDIDDVAEPMKKVYDKGIVAAEKALYAYSPAYYQAVKGDPGAREEGIEILDDGANLALYWYATNLGKWALLDGIGTALGEVGTVYAMMKKIEAETPTLWHHGPYRYLAGYHSKIPIVGPDLDKSKSYFDKAIEAAPNYLGTRVLYAEFYAYKVDDKDLFREQLEMVVAADPAAEPSIEPENRIEQKKAERLLSKIDDMF